ncbi:MAG TPA: hypothetical protein VFS00_24050, partial [Polyangiaceae bacterium]|nr:hypothetical protein [Polyangiaceae bacterium]
PEARDDTRLLDRARFAAWEGDFEGALRRANEIERRARGRAPSAPRSDAGGLIAEISFETGRDPRAAEAAEEVAPSGSVGLREAQEGHALLQAGDAARAAPLLEAAAASCQGLEHPFVNVRAHLWLGQARERLGDAAGACAAYAAVTRRWGGARPASTTASEAKRRQRALGCPDATRAPD